MASSITGRLQKSGDFSVRFFRQMEPRAQVVGTEQHLELDGRSRLKSIGVESDVAGGHAPAKTLGCCRMGVNCARITAVRKRVLSPACNSSPDQQTPPGVRLLGR